jgi:hypothetical protein
MKKKLDSGEVVCFGLKNVLSFLMARPNFSFSWLRLRLCEVSTMDAIESRATVAAVTERGLVVHGGTHRRQNCSAVRRAIQTWITDMLVTEDPPIVLARRAKTGSCVHVGAIERV